MRMADPEVASNPDEFRKLSKSVSDIEETVNSYREYKSIVQQLGDARNMLKEEKDQELIEMAREEIQELQQKEVGRLKL